jgi:hypothetical protein
LGILAWLPKNSHSIDTIRFLPVGRSSNIGSIFLGLGAQAMAKRFLSGVFAGLGLSGLALAQGQFAIGSSEIVPPAGWQLASSTEDRLVFQTADNHQLATVSVLQLMTDATFEDFTRLCIHRL